MRLETARTSLDMEIQRSFFGQVDCFKVLKTAPEMSKISETFPKYEKTITSQNTHRQLLGVWK